MRELGTPLIDAFAPSGARGRRDSRSCLVPLPREAAGVAKHGELGDVPAEAERDGPVGDDPQLSRRERELIEVVCPRREPAEEAAEAEPEHVADPLVAPQRRHHPAHAVAIRPRRPLQVLRQSPRLAEGVLARRWIRVVWRGRVQHAGAVAKRPDVAAALDAKNVIHAYPAALVEGEAELGE